MLTERTIAVKPFCRLCLHFTSLPLSSIHQTFSSRFFFLIIEKNKVCEKGSVLTSVRWKLSVFIFSLTEKTARVMKMVITSQLFFRITLKNGEVLPHISTQKPKKQKVVGGFHMTSSPPCWWTKTKDLSLASFVRLPEVVLFSILLLVSLEVG